MSWAHMEEINCSSQVKAANLKILPCGIPATWHFWKVKSIDTSQRLAVAKRLERERWLGQTGRSFRTAKTLLSNIVMVDACLYRLVETQRMHSNKSELLVRRMYLPWLIKCNNGPLCGGCQQWGRPCLLQVQEKFLWLLLGVAVTLKHPLPHKKIKSLKWKTMRKL